MVDDKHTPPKHRTVKGAQRLRDLTSVAAELFLERGFDGVAVDDLIARVGGSRSTIYSHFGDKEGLFKEAMTSLCAEVAKPLDQLHITGREPSEVLSLLGRQLLVSALSPRTLALHRLLVNEGRRFPDVAHAMWEVSYGRAVEILARWISEQQRSTLGLTSTVPAQALAEHFISMVASNAKLRAASGLVTTPLPESEVSEIVRYAVNTFLHGALDQPTRPTSRKSGPRSRSAT
ncbi:TetR/AcrR family transcriptional regulator [Variovorax gossypii]|uniref:TetR/AcrR family transcriptional regulator n=1 Tax=Variovorax gossypii TaxID=1679495 RepID=A0A431TPH8_9BURK|nr:MULTISPECIES: TetR/AcrR family transcriptional regulator [Variovorax]MDR6522090.1 AcrR family transcriptional regulator [Variovorax paradoxus]RTQ35602.1 TetR/AcrR family transcriptional regulator [Variovorax gossypii]